jgi:antitoxin component YwqK of YwqJK toxin-antitoxin module
MARDFWIGAVAVAALVACRGNSLPPNAGRCAGRETVETYWKKRLGGMQYVDSKGHVRQMHTAILAGPQVCIRAHCIDGVWDGEWVRWHPNGIKQREGHFNAGIPVGDWPAWDADGGLIGSSTFDGGTGRWIEWHENGVRADEGDYVAGEQTGTWRAWSPDGALLSESELVHGLRHGRSTWYLADGGIRRTAAYAYGLELDGGAPRAMPKELPPPAALEDCGP